MPQQTQQIENDASPIRAFYAAFIQADDLCFDVGAHVGARTDLFLSLGARVVCVEPQPRCVQVLRQKYGNDPRVSIIPAGAAEKCGSLTMSLCHAAPTISTFSEKWKTGRFHDYNWSAAAKVPVTTLDLLIGQFGVPAFCKIDVEGYEHAVLRGLSRPVPMLSFEFTREFIDDARACMDHLASLGQVEFNCGLGEATTFALAQWSPATDVSDHLRSQPDELLWGDIYARFPAVAKRRHPAETERRPM